MTFICILELSLQVTRSVGKIGLCGVWQEVTILFSNFCVLFVHKFSSVFCLHFDVAISYCIRLVSFFCSHT